jgi:hypothetical protein
MDGGAVGFAFGVGDVSAVDADPNRDRLVRVSGVALLDGALDRHRGLDCLVGRREERHETVAEPLDVGSAAGLDLGADQPVVFVEDFVGGGVAQPDPEVGGPFEVGEENRLGALIGGVSLAHSPLHCIPRTLTVVAWVVVLHDGCDVRFVDAASGHSARPNTAIVDGCLRLGAFGERRGAGMQGLRYRKECLWEFLYGCWWD